MSQFILNINPIISGFSFNGFNAGISVLHIRSGVAFHREHFVKAENIVAVAVVRVVSVLDRSDADGLCDLGDPDDDNDGIEDGVEDANHSGTVDAGETDPCNPDTDGDGFSDEDDNCPANAVGRPLSPRFISIKCRDYSFRKYSLTGKLSNERPLIGHVLEEDEIWSCTTCGACEQECPLFIEYIDKIVDLRRGLVDEGKVPQSLQKPLRAIEKRGNPYGKMEKKRVDWTQEIAEDCPVKILEKGKNVKPS